MRPKRLTTESPLAESSPADQRTEGSSSANGWETPMLAHKHGINLVVGLLIASGGMCPKCGYGTRATSKKWARCKKCGERVERVKMQDIKLKAVAPGTPNDELCSRADKAEPKAKHDQ